jgi:two-component system, sensor histidine kinase and response regulator
MSSACIVVTQGPHQGRCRRQTAFSFWLLNGIFFPVVILLCGPDGAAQSVEIARLHRSLASRDDGAPGQSPDNAYIDTLCALAHAFYGIDADSAMLYGNRAIADATRTDYAKGESEGWRMLGNTYEMMGDYTRMLSSYHRSLAIAERIGNINLVARANINIALFYKQVGEYDRARRLMEKVSELCKTGGDTVQYAYLFAHLSDLAFHQQHYDKALEYARDALRLAESARDSQSIAAYNNDIGRVLVAKGFFHESTEHHFLQSLDYYRKVNDKLGMIATTVLLAQVKLRQHDYNMALRYAGQAYIKARSINRKKEIQESARALADIYEAKGDNRLGREYFKLYKDFSDSVYDDQRRQHVFEMAAQSEYDQKEARSKEDQAHKDMLQQRALQKATLLITIAALLIIFLIILSFVLMRSRKLSRKANELLLEKNAKIEEQREAMEHQAVQLLLNNQQKDKLFSIIAHDLRGPLNSLKGLMDFLKEKRLSEQEISSMMGELRRSVDYSSELVGNLLFWASTQLNGIVVTPVVLPLKAMIRAILPLYVQQAKDKGIDLLDELPSGLAGYADKDMIQVVIRNLLSNAIKFCRSGDHVTISSRVIKNVIEVCVADTGTGIKTEMLEKIRRNESVTSYGTAREKGTGLGMLLCKEFTEANNGVLRIESEWGKGCKCYFTIPAATIAVAVPV